MAELLQRQLSRRMRMRMLSLWWRHHALATRPDLQPTTLNRRYSSTRQQQEQERSAWVELPPFAIAPQVDTAALASGGRHGHANSAKKTSSVSGVCALKWIRRCCPQLPLSLLHKLFRLRQVKKTIPGPNHQPRFKRLSAKDALSPGDVLCLPPNLRHSLPPPPPPPPPCKDANEMNFLRTLQLYKDDSVIVLNKPPGMPVQGGVGIRCSLDSLATKYLKYDYPDGPRLVHRLDRDSSGVLVLGRDQASATLLHSIFREKTSSALSDDAPRVLQRRYIALVIGTPRRSTGLISVPLAKVLLEDGKSERITVSDDPSAQHALTEYYVIESFSNGLTWLELSPLTGRKHQLRVHCAEVLRTPIVGDTKYGRRVHKRWKPVPLPSNFDSRSSYEEQLPFGLKYGGGTIAERQPSLHLHCKQMILPDISCALKMGKSTSDSDQDLSGLKKLNIVAPLPSHMQTSWEILKSL